MDKDGPVAAAAAAAMVLLLRASLFGLSSVLLRELGVEECIDSVSHLTFAA